VTVNQGVVGSSPTSGAIYFKGLRVIAGPFCLADEKSADKYAPAAFSFWQGNAGRPHIGSNWVMTRITIALVLVALFAGCAWGADERSGEPGEARSLDALQVTARRRAESAHEVTAATTVIDAGRIRGAAAQTAMDLLHGEPGTFVQQTTPGQAIVVVRGLKGSEVLHLVDGFRLNNAFFRNAPNQYMALVDGQALERIEVVRGPASTLYGGDAMGGVLQLLTPELTLDGREATHGRLRAQYAGADRAWQSRLDGAAVARNLALSGGVSWQDVDDVRVGGGERRPHTAFEARAANAKLQWRLAGPHELLLQAQWLEQPSTPRVDELVPGFGQSHPASSEFAFEPQVRRFVQARYRFRGEALAFDRLDAQIGRQTIVDDRRSREFESLQRDREANSSRLDGVSLVAGKALGAHALSYGGELYDDTVRSARLREQIDTGVVTIRAPRFPDGSRMRQWGAFVADDWQLGSVDLSGGVRYSRVRTRLPESAGFGVVVDADDLSGNLGLGVALDEEWKAVANVGRAFRPPNVFDLGTFGDRPGGRFNIPNPQLQPERVATVDLGVKHHGAHWSAEAFMFASRYHDKITSVLTGETTASGRAVTQSRNATNLDLRGFEAGLRGALRDDLELYASATFTHGQERYAGEEYPADRIPPWYGKLGAAWRVSERVELEGYAYYATRQDRLSPRDAADPRIDPRGTGGWASWNARLGYRASERLDLSLRLENLADKRYREHGSGLEEPGLNAIVMAERRF
jgi:hemoglobin/transferrin/lactoferrin receptor protein